MIQGKGKKGITAYQKIVEAHLLNELSDGRTVLRLDKVFCHEITTPNAILDMQERNCDVVFDQNRIFAVIDHVSPAKDSDTAIQGKILRDWCRKHDITFFDVGRNGVCHALFPEKGLILPGEVAIMGDSHTCTYGAFGAFTAGVGTTELEVGIQTGTWGCAPQKVIRVNFTGKLPANVFSKDLILTLLNRIGVKGATNAVLEFGGNVIEEMSMDARMTITNMAVEAGATSGMMMVDETTVKYLWPVLKEKYGEHHIDEYDRDVLECRNVLRLVQAFNSDHDAVYERIIGIDVTDLAPVVTQGYLPSDVVSVESLSGHPAGQVDQVYIGSCTNGRLEDLRIAAYIFCREGKQVAPGVRCIINPATPEIYRDANSEGILDELMEAGAVVTNPSCGACLGMSCGVLADGEICVSTTNRNFFGRMGRGGMVHLASPATAAWTAIHGYISCPPANYFLPHELANLRSTHCAIPHFSKQKDIPAIDYVVLADAQLKMAAKIDFSGQVCYLPQGDINTDLIIPAKYLTLVNKIEMGKHCLEDASMTPDERTRLFQSQILVAGANFGCGSSREHAPWALQANGIRCVIAPSFARIFLDSMFALGMLCIEASEELYAEIISEQPKQMTIAFGADDEDLNKLVLIIPVAGDNHVCREVNISSHQMELIKSSGSVGYMLNLSAELQQEGKL